MNIKGMDKNMCCRGFRFEIGKEYKKENDGRPLELCSDTVFHYCKSLQHVHQYYSCHKESNRYFEIEVLGEEITDGNKYGSNHIKIIREITGDELKALKGLNNNNTGLFNSGYMNSGNMNSGNMNSGDRNSGNMNSGDMNSGDRNSGNMNSGDMNSGNMNSGVANKCNFSNGVFCNESDMNIRIFNKPSGMSLHDFFNSRYWDAMCNAPFNFTEWVEYTPEEMAADHEKERRRGYLKENSYKEAWDNWWKMLDEESKQVIQEMPNFDADIFRDITGIELK